ncbi:MAG: TIGR01244 family phosphatase [Caulobacterales bacterium]|nr:TIGR01244 family phosphatase [Caulobacterales bacterium]
MDIRILDDRLHAAPQIALAEVADAAARGYGAIVSNRPDDEEPGQPSADQMRQAAEAAGLGFRHIPVRPGALREVEADAMRAALEELPGPILGFCRTGTRTTYLWALAVAGSRPADEIAAAASAAGYDLTPLRAYLGG